MERKPSLGRRKEFKEALTVFEETKNFESLANLLIKEGSNSGVSIASALTVILKGLPSDLHTSFIDKYISKVEERWRPFLNLEDIYSSNILDKGHTGTTVRRRIISGLDRVETPLSVCELLLSAERRNLIRRSRHIYKEDIEKFLSYRISPDEYVTLFPDDHRERVDDYVSKVLSDSSDTSSLIGLIKLASTDVSSNSCYTVDHSDCPHPVCNKPKGYYVRVTGYHSLPIIVRAAETFAFNSSQDDSSVNPILDRLFILEGKQELIKLLDDMARLHGKNPLMDRNEDGKIYTREKRITVEGYTLLLIKSDYNNDRDSRISYVPGSLAFANVAKGQQLDLFKPRRF